MILNPWAHIRRLRAELTATEALLADAQRKLTAGGRARAEKERERVMATAEQIRSGLRLAGGQG